ncbi:hypothetical protein ACFO9E_15490 [Streptomyces maoxianensis]|uniref:Putative antitoxin VapB45-like DNA-binding HTH domain-containing protein n=1 Tax=Streptomyces maoxianensis TaxID=1459942 RepID=A0ABV9G8G5_9ACTN
MMGDRFTDALLTPTETSSYLEIPPSTLTSWLKGTAANAPLVHQVAPTRNCQPSVPFIAVAEAHVLRSLRSLGLRMDDIPRPRPARILGPGSELTNEQAELHERA